MARKPELFKRIGIIETIISLFMLCLMRNFCGNLTFVVDTMICIGLALSLYQIRLPKWLSSVMKNLGKHSMNIFLFHTFFFLYWFEDYIYITRNPLLIFLSLLLSCWIVSVVIEFIKNKVGLYLLLK